jgi:CheY-like chemotaxis protein
MRLEIESTPPTFVDNAVAEAAFENRASDANEALREGIKAAQAGDRAKARAALLRASDLDPSSESAWLWLASISEYPEELLVFLNNVLDLNPLNARATEWMAATKSLLAKTFVQRGIDAANGGQNDFAAQCFNQALEHDQNNAMAWLWMASLSDSNEGKLSYLEKVLELEPENESALTAYRSAKHSINQSLLAEARSAAVAGRKSDANELLEAFIAENPESEDGWILRSHLADAFEEKIAAFEKVLVINPGSPAARAGLDSLRAIMETVASTGEVQPAAVPDQMENMAVALNAAREQENAGAHDKSPTQELVFPAAVLEMVQKAESEKKPVQVEEVVYFDEAEETFTESAVEFEPEQHPEINPDWGMNTIAFSFAFPGGEQNVESNGNGAAAEGDSFDFSVSPEPAYESEAVEDDALIEAVAFESEPVPAPVSEPLEEFRPVPSPFDSFATITKPAVTEEFSFGQAEPAPEFVPAPAPAENGYTNGHSEMPAMSFEPVVEPADIDPEPFVEQSIPMPVDFSIPVLSQPTGFETRVVRPENPEPHYAGFAACPFCNAENPTQAFTCGSCLSTLTLSDLEMLLANTHADKLVLREAVEKMETERTSRALTENELTTLGIGHLNLRDLQTGYLYLHEASQLNPNNVVLGSQVNALLIRLDEIKRQEEVHDAMPKEKKILVVDDSATVRKLIAGKLEKCGHEVFCAADGVEAIEQLDAVVPDLILLDITMPRMDGYQVCKVIRSKDSTKDVPVVMISGKDGFFDKVRGRMAGSTGYITKPFGPETLMKAVETYLKGEEL